MFFHLSLSEGGREVERKGGREERKGEREGGRKKGGKEGRKALQLWYFCVLLKPALLHWRMDITFTLQSPGEISNCDKGRARGPYPDQPGAGGNGRTKTGKLPNLLSFWLSKG